jgi:hypothetical protein
VRSECWRTPWRLGIRGDVLGCIDTTTWQPPSALTGHPSFEWKFVITTATNLAAL